MEITYLGYFDKCASLECNSLVNLAIAFSEKSVDGFRKKGYATINQKKFTDKMRLGLPIWFHNTEEKEAKLTLENL